MNVYFAEKQDGRLVHYESAYYNRAYEDTISDLETRMYAKPEDVELYLNNSPKKPYILCEFMHDMGNSMGGLGSYMKLIDKYDMYHGGFIWDYIDQAIMVKDPVTGKRCFYDMAEILTINQQTMNSQQMELYLLTGKKNQRCRK